MTLKFIPIKDHLKSNFFSIHIREPKSCQAALAVLVDDLLRSYNDGYAVRDMSLPENHPQRDFRMRVMLLNWIGDYKGQAKIANMKHQGKQSCHWCMHTFRKGLGQTGSNFADNNRRYLPRRSPLREDRDYGEDSLNEEENRPPEIRTHKSIWDTGMEITCGDGTDKEKEALATQSGINGLCCLGLLPMFDLALDIMLDFMHVLKNIWQEHLLPVFRGTGVPGRPKPYSIKRKKPEVIQEEREVHNKRMKLYREVSQVHCTPTYRFFPASIHRTYQR
jgi:hypothetical protein